MGDTKKGIRSSVWLCRWRSALALAVAVLVIVSNPAISAETTADPITPAPA